MLMKRRFIFEADDDGDSTTPSDPTVSSTDTSSDDSSSDSDSNTDDSSSDDNSDDTSDDNDDSSDDSSDDNSDDNSDDDSDEDYSIDAEPDEDSGDDSGTDDSSDDSGSDDSSSDSDSEDKELDRNMFDSLSDDEKNRKISTLKKNFVALYGRCDALIEKFNQIDDEDDDQMSSIVKRIIGILFEMKEYLSYYTLNVYDNNSYIENDITFNRYLSVLNGIKLATEELEKEHNEEKDKKN